MDEAASTAIGGDAHHVDDEQLSQLWHLHPLQRNARPRQAEAIRIRIKGIRCPNDVERRTARFSRTSSGGCHLEKRTGQWHSSIAFRNAKLAKRYGAPVAE